MGNNEVGINFIVDWMDGKMIVVVGGGGDDDREREIGQTRLEIW